MENDADFIEPSRQSRNSVKFKNGRMLECFRNLKF